MGEALREGGLYYVRGVAVDAEGKKVEGAPKKPKDTPANQQPGAGGVLTPEERQAILLSKAIKGELVEPSTDDEESTDDGELPTVADLENHLAGIDDLDELKAMKRRDRRATAKPIYEKRIEELKAQE